MAEQKAEKFLEYKGKPLVRFNNMIYYGDLNDPYVVFLTVKTQTELKDIKLADKVGIQLFSTDESLKPQDRIIKSSVKEGLFTALDLASVWLERYLKEN